MSQAKTPFNAMLSKEDYEMLAQVAAARECSMALIIRNAIRYTHQHLIRGVPTCAAGYACFVPHMHGIQPQAQPPLPQPPQPRGAQPPVPTAGSAAHETRDASGY
jgi:hypothetical protein